MAFYGRQTELKRLSKVFSAAGLQVVLVYGRRRIGKSELIRQALKTLDFASIYYECKETSQENNLSDLSEVSASSFGLPPLGFSNLEKLLDFVFDKACNSPVALVLDEYQYLRNAVKGFDSVLQSLIDRYKGRSMLKLVICGSYIDIMVSLLESSNPLFGRVDCTIFLQEMDYYDSSQFYSGYSNEDKVRLYSVFGGVPYYNALVDSSLTVRENIIGLVASSGARLENEVPMYLKSEISRVSNANQVVEAMAKGYCKFSDILAQSHVSSSPVLADVLAKLSRMGILAKKAPINDEFNKKKTKYEICDNLSMFYYRYVFKNLSRMRVMEEDAFFDKYIADDFSSWYVPHMFERVCAQYLIRKNKINKAPIPFYRIGSLWYDDRASHTNGEFDIVTEGEDGYVFYECKFTNSPVGKDVIDEEIAQIVKAGFKAFKCGFFSKTGFEDGLDVDYALIALDDLFV